MTDFDRAFGFSHALAQDAHARRVYERLTPADKCRVLARAGHIQSADNLRLYVMSLSDQMEAREYF